MPRKPGTTTTGFEVFAAKVKTNVESLIIFATAVNTDGPGQRLWILANFNYKVAKGTKTITVKIKRGGGEGVAVGEWVGVAVTPETTMMMTFACIDNAPVEVAEIGNQAQYSLTILTAGAEAEGETPFATMLVWF